MTSPLGSPDLGPRGRFPFSAAVAAWCQPLPLHGPNNKDTEFMTHTARIHDRCRTLPLLSQRRRASAPACEVRPC